MKDNKYICRFIASVALCAYAYYGVSRMVESMNPVSEEEGRKPLIYLTSGEAIDPATAPITTKFEEDTAKEFAAEAFGDVTEAPDLNEFLSRFTCSSCGKRCLLASPSCFVGNGRQESAIKVYQEMYPEVEIF